MYLKNTNNYIGIFYAILAFFAVSFSDTISKFALKFQFMPINYYFIYVKLASLIIILILGTLLYKRRFFIVTNKKQMFVISIIFSIHSLTTIFGIYFLPLATFYSIAFIMPFISIVIGIMFLKEQFNTIKFLAIVVGFAGVIIILNPTLNYKNTSTTGIIFALIAAFSLASGSALARKYFHNDSSLKLTFYPLILSLILGMAMLYPDVKINNIIIPDKYDIFMISLSAFFTVLGVTLYIKASQNAEARYTAPMQYTQLLWGVFLGYAFFADKPSYETTIGTIMIVLAIFITLFKAKKTPYTPITLTHMPESTPTASVTPAYIVETENKSTNINEKENTN